MTQCETSPNVYGIETEYSVLITPNENTIREIVGACHSVDVKLGLYQQPKERGSIEINEDDYTDALEELGIIRNQMGMLTNGGRFSVDPSGPEYDTPETRTAEDAVLRMFDGDRIMHAVFHHLCETGVIRSYQLNRKIVDHNRTSRGIHLNTYTNYKNDYQEKDMPGPDAIAILSTLNVVKGSLFGSGGLLLNDEGETEYHHSPRLSITTDEWDHSKNYYNRPLVRVPFKPDGGNCRIETVTSDALNFGWPLRASMVLTNAVVGLIELEDIGCTQNFPIIHADNVVKAAHTVGQHGWDSNVQVEDKRRGSRYQPTTKVLRQICELVRAADAQHNYLDDESKQVIQEIVKTIDIVETDWRLAANRIESIARYITIKRKLGELSLDSEKACRLDYAWDWIGGGFAERLRERGAVGWHGFTQANTPSVVKKRLVTPPQDTRAHIRADVIRLMGKDDRSTWDSLGSRQGYVDPIAAS